MQNKDDVTTAPLRIHTHREDNELEYPETVSQNGEPNLEDCLNYIGSFEVKSKEQTNPLLKSNLKPLTTFFHNFHLQATALNDKNLNDTEQEQLYELVNTVAGLAQAALEPHIKEDAILDLVKNAEGICNELPKRSFWKTLGAIALAIAAATFLALCIVSAVMVLGLGLGGTAPLAAALLWMGIQATELALTITLAATAGASLVASPVLFFAAYKTMPPKPQTAELEAITRDGLGLFKMPPTPAEQLKDPEAAYALD